MSNKTSDIVKLINSGILPNELNFSEEMMKRNTGAELDLGELKYNWFYRDYSYWASKFPAGHESIPGFDKIIQSIADNALTPLEEIEERKNKSLDNDNVECGEELTMGQGLHPENRD